MRVGATSLVIDQHYVVKEANRLLRALFDIAFHYFARQVRTLYRTRITILCCCCSLSLSYQGY